MGSSGINPHASELEVNIWIFPNGHSPVVVPVRKPTCSGEGYQNNVVSFTVPVDFAELGSKIPGFTGCNAATRPMCTVQVYAHSVESRTYATAFPIIIPNHDTSRTTTSTAQILPAANDPGMDLSSLRDLCLPSSDASADIPNAQPRWAKLVSDVYNHAYQNSDFSPYSGQQHDKISKNLQASAINKMITGNRGELGKNALPSEMKNQIKKLQKLEDKIYKTYESLANKIIKNLGNSMKQTGTIKAGGTTQQLANCFRCDQVGSTLTKRQTTNTYIPSFELPAALVADAQKLVPAKYAGLIAVDPQTNKAVVKIYETAMTDLSKLFSDATAYGIIYQPAMVKTTLVTMSDATQFKKRTANNGKDKGEYAAKVAKIAFAKGIGCAETCLKSQTGEKPSCRALKQQVSQGSVPRAENCLKILHSQQQFLYHPLPLILLVAARFRPLVHRQLPPTQTFMDLIALAVLQLPPRLPFGITHLRRSALLAVATTLA